jgi:hypothetical protein
VEVGFPQSGEVTQVSISPPSQTVNAGQTFTVNVFIEPAEAIAGAQFNLSFDPALLTANSVAEGNLLKQNGALTVFGNGTINNSAGTITNVYGAIITAGATVSSPETLASISFTAKTSAGTSPVTLHNVVVGNATGGAVTINVTDGDVTINIPATPTPTPTPTLTSTPSPTPGPGISITLNEGWNFIAGPDGTMSVDVALASISGKYLWITTCAPSETPTYKTYVPSNTSGSNNLTQMDRLHGYWIFMTEGATLNYPE